MANGYEHDAQVVYGDTDSVMIKFGTEDLGKSMELAKEAADRVTATFIKPIKLEFEKCYYPYLLMNKKRYAGLLWTNTEKHDKMDCKGIETVRRDFCGLVKDVVETSLKAILIHKNPEMAVQYVKGQARLGEIGRGRWELAVLLDSGPFLPSLPLRHLAQISKLLMNEMDMTKLVISKTLTKTSDQYAAGNKQARRADGPATLAAPACNLASTSL